MLIIRLNSQGWIDSGDVDNTFDFFLICEHWWDRKQAMHLQIMCHELNSFKSQSWLLVKIYIPDACIRHYNVTNEPKRIMLITPLSLFPHRHANQTIPFF